MPAPTKQKIPLKRRVQQKLEKLDAQVAESKPTKPRAILKLFGAEKKSPLIWFASSYFVDWDTTEQLNAWYGAIKHRNSKATDANQTAERLFDEFETSISNQNGHPVSISRALQTIAAAHAIPAIRASENDSAWPAIELLISQSEQLNLVSSNSGETVLIEQLIAIELPLTIAFQCPDVLVPNDLAEPAAAWMADTVQEVLDDDGWPRADLLPLFGMLLASWTRSLKLIHKLKIEFDSAAEGQLEWAVRQLLRLLRADETLMFSHPNSAAMAPECLKLLLQMSGDRADQELAKTVALRNVETSGKKKSKKKREHSQPSSISEWGESAVLQSGWHRGAPKLGFDYSRKSFQIEVTAGRSLVMGNAYPQITFDGQLTLPIDNFEIVCNESDADLEYVELQQPLTQSLTLTRQLILSRDEEFLIVADCVVPLVPGEIEYQCEWPLASSVSIVPESETREIYLTDPKIQALVLPLSLPEWKVGPTNGRLMPLDDCFRLTDAINGAGLYVPLVFDLSPKRAKKKRTWRSLTVSQERVAITRDVGAAFRFQLHEQQWFFYRAISEKGNRTFLGENFNGEFLISRFDRKGAISELLRIE